MFIPSFTIASVRTRAACLGQDLTRAEPPSGAQPLSLKEATALAVQRSALLTAGDARIKAAIEEVGRADQLPDPMLTFGVESVPISGSDAFSLSDDEMTMRSMGVSQAQCTPRFGLGLAGASRYGQGCQCGGDPACKRECLDRSVGCATRTRVAA